MIKGNKYNAKTENQLKFGERIENEYGWVCNFSIMSITRGRGWSVSSGSCSSSISIQNFRDAKAYYIRLYHPIREYLSKKKYLTACRDGTSIDLEYEINEPKNSFGYEIPNKTRIMKNGLVTVTFAYSLPITNSTTQEIWGVIHLVKPSVM